MYPCASVPSFASVGSPVDVAPNAPTSFVLAVLNAGVVPFWTTVVEYVVVVVYEYVVVVVYEYVVIVVEEYVVFGVVEYVVFVVEE